MNKWLQMSDAPQDRQIILDVGLPWSVVGIYNSISEKWVYASLQIGMYEGDYSDTYFENEYEKSPKSWQKMAEINRD